MTDKTKNPPPPSPNANWEQFITGIPGFVPALNDGMDCIVRMSHEGKVLSGADVAIANLTGSLAENLYDVLFLCANERRDGAMRLLRTPYEKYLYAHFISGHPETAEDFELFNFIQSKALISGIKEQYEYEMSNKGQTALDQLVKAAQVKIKRNKCKECGESLPRMWTKVTPEQMAKAANLEAIHILAYRYATVFIHPSMIGIDAQADQSVQMPSILVIVHRLIFETIKLQWLQFKKTRKMTGRTAEVMGKLAEVAKL